jgi:tripartite-type tricarboxylate transporter receptor subunit TctC
MGCATSGVGSNQHVLLAWFARDAQIKLEHVPYRGAGQAINDVLAGHVQVAFLGPTALLPQYKAGKLRLLAQTGRVRSRSLPEVPTLEESGFPGLVLESWYAAFVPLGTPPALIARLNAPSARRWPTAARGRISTRARRRSPEACLRILRVSPARISTSTRAW